MKDFEAFTIKMEERQQGRYNSIMEQIEKIKEAILLFAKELDSIKDGDN